LSDARSFFRNIKKHPERFYIIHYSSQSLYDEGVDGLSPRITSIVVMHFSTRQTVSFAIHAVAEDLGIPRDEVEGRYDEIERALLERFYVFVRDRREKYWVHWNMRNIVFGFEHLEHRYRTLTRSEPPHIPIEVRINLNDALKERYGSGFAKDPRMLSLMLLNGERDKRFLEGNQEAEAFKNKEFIRMNSSTICKVEFFRHVMILAQKGRLRTASKGLLVGVDRLLDSRWSRIFALSASTLGFLMTCRALINLFFSH
jgi:hypothetical protein